MDLLMPLPLTDRITLASLLVASVSDPVANYALVDWLLERNVSTEDVAILYAGTLPEYQDGLSHRCLAMWLDARGADNWAAQVRALTSASVLHPRTVRQVKRSVLSLPWVRQVRLVVQACRHVLALPNAADWRAAGSVAHPPKRYREFWQSIEVDMNPAVSVERTVSCRENGIVLLTSTQVLSAPQLIHPDDQPLIY